jgi:IS5 family transposase
LGSKHHVVCCGSGIPLAVTVTAANRNDITQLLELVDRIAPVGPHGKFRPKVLLADRAYDSRRHRAELRQRGITPKIFREDDLRPGRERFFRRGVGPDRWMRVVVQFRGKQDHVVTAFGQSNDPAGA